jgi:hypothetical protein
LLVLATPYRGRALPFGFVTFSSRTIAQSGCSRNQYHWQAFEQLKDLVGDKPLVLDRDFSYADLLEYLTAADIHFVIRLNLRSHPPTFVAPDGRKLPLAVSLGQQVACHQLRYRDRVAVNVAGSWRRGHSEPLWVISDLPAEQALTIYTAHMKIDETFRNLKNLLPPALSGHLSTSGGRFRLWIYALAPSGASTDRAARKTPRRVSRGPVISSRH